MGERGMKTYTVDRIFADGRTEDRTYSRLRDARRSLQFSGTWRPRGLVEARLYRVDSTGERAELPARPDVPGSRYMFRLGNVEFGRLLRDARKLLRLTQAQLGERLGRDGNTIARWERGEVTLDRLAQIGALSMCQENTKFSLDTGRARGILCVTREER